MVGGLLVGAGLVCAATSWVALLANHPAYPTALLVAVIAGIGLLVSGWRTRTPPRRTPMSRIERGAAAIGGLAIAGLLLWLQPAVATQRGLDSLSTTATVTVIDSRQQTIYEPAVAPTAGLVLYPGAKVDPRAYAPIARGIAEGGFRVVVPKCAFDLALLCENAAATSLTPDIPWAVGGHSLGGVAAASFASRTPVDGLVLLASYPLSDLSERGGLRALSLSGTRDGLTTPDDIDARKHLMPRDTQYSPIIGAIHAHFGDYGQQRGDGVPTITRAQAQSRIVTDATDFLASLGDAPED